MGPTTVAIRSPFQTHTMSGNLGRSGPSVAILITCFYLANRRFPVSVLWIRWLYLCALTGVVCFIIVFVIHFFHVITCFLRVVLIVRGFNWEFREKNYLSSTSPASTWNTHDGQCWHYEDNIWMSARGSVKNRWNDKVKDDWVWKKVWYQ